MARPPLTVRTTQLHQPESLFEDALGTPAVGNRVSVSQTGITKEREDELLEQWESLRDSGIEPLHQSYLSQDEEQRREFLRGAWMLELIDRRKTLKPQQLRVSDVLAGGHSTTGVLIPRRATKSTSVFAVMLGRCLSRPDYQVAFTMCTTGQKARERFRKDIVAPLNRMFPDPKNRPFRIFLTGGSERIEFANGSFFGVYPPIGDIFRSEAFDVVILDEAGAAGPEMTADLLQGILSTFDTRPGAQMVIAGTAADFRDGNLLWDTLVLGRVDPTKTGIIEYAAPDHTTEADLSEWSKVEKLVRAAHPGIDTLTTIDIVRERWSRLKPEQFAKEYLSIFGTAGANTGILDMEKWLNGGLKSKLPEPPERFAIGIAVHPEQTYASIVAVWRVGAKARVLVLEHRRGVDWLAQRSRELAAKYRAPIAHDTNGPIMAEVEVLRRMRSPKPRLIPQTLSDVKTAAALLVREVENNRVQHYNQDMLTSAARLAKKRAIGPTAWAFGRPDMEDDITPIEAASFALHAFDENVRAPRNMKVRVAA